MKQYRTSPRNLWLPIDAVDAISENAVQRYILHGLSLVAWRCADEVIVMDDICPHRGARLSDGQVIERAIACPYHGLRFDAFGHCVLAPTESRIPALRARLRRTYQWGGLLLVKLDDNEDRFPLPPPPRFLGSRLTLCGPYHWRASPLDVIENFIDVAHLPFVHEGVLGDKAYPQVSPFAIEMIEDRPASTEIEVFQPSPTGHAAPDRSRYVYRLLTPLAAEFRKEFSGEEYRTVLLVTPTWDDACTIWLVVAHSSEHQPDAIRKFQDQIMEQDRAIIEGIAVARGKGRRALSALPSDTLLVAYRKWLANQNFALKKD